MRPTMVLITTQPTDKYPEPTAFLVHSTETTFKVLKTIRMREYSTIKLIKALWAKGFRTMGQWKKISHSMAMIQLSPTQ